MYYNTMQRIERFPAKGIKTQISPHVKRVSKKNCPAPVSRGQGGILTPLERNEQNPYQLLSQHGIGCQYVYQCVLYHNTTPPDDLPHQAARGVYHRSLTQHKIIICLASDSSKVENKYLNNSTVTNLTL